MNTNTAQTVYKALMGVGGAAVIVFAVIWFQPDTTLPVSTPKTETSETIPEKSVVGTLPTDTDNDGIPDFEESLWGTDMNNPDSDGDGTRDGEEVLIGRDPSKAGPDDAVETPLLLNKKRDIPFTPQKQVVLPTYSAPKQSTVTPVTNPASDNPLYTFGNELGSYIVASSADQEAELAFWNSAVGNTKMNERLVSGFNELANKYDTLTQNLSSVSTPSNATTAKNGLATAYRSYTDSIRAIAKTPLDTYMQGDTLNAYGDATRILGQAFVAMSDLFYTENIYFGPEEPGNVFTFPR